MYAPLTVHIKEGSQYFFTAKKYEVFRHRHFLVFPIFCHGGQINFMVIIDECLVERMDGGVDVFMV